jgi:hypothetical protein
VVPHRWWKKQSNQGYVLRCRWWNTEPILGTVVRGRRRRIECCSWALLGNSRIAAGEDCLAFEPNSIALGRKAASFHAGTFVWSDSTGGATSSAKNQFTVKASGGARFFSDAAMSTGVTLAAGGGAWAAVSDRNVKENIEPVIGEEVLRKLAGIPIAEWNYITQDDAIRHIGPMAQDFHAAFGVGEDDRHITTIDADGVLMAAVQALHKENQSQESEIVALRELIVHLRDELESLKSAKYR